MATANEAFQDLLIAHAIEVERFGNGLVRRLMRVLEQSDAELASTLIAELQALGPNVFLSTRKVRRLRKILKSLAAQRGEAYAAVHAQLREELRSFAVLEGRWTAKAFDDAVGVMEAQLVVPAITTLRTVPTNRPIDGRFLKEWSAKLRADDAALIMKAVQSGLEQGLSLDEIVNGLRGTEEQGFRDGLLWSSRRHATDVVRTAANFVANTAREAVFQANTDLIQGLRWTSVLDGRTTLVCATRDGRVAVLGEDRLPDDVPRLEPPSLRPPAHINCRSIMVAYISYIGIVGERPFVTSTLTGREKRIEFRDLAREKAGRAWESMSRSARAAAVAAARNQWGIENIGRLPAKTTFLEFFSRQSAKFQTEYLGRVRYRLYTQGTLGLDDMVDASGKEYTLDQLFAGLTP